MILHLWCVPPLRASFRLLRLKVRQKRQEAGLEGSAKGKLKRLPNHVLAKQSVRCADILVPGETVAPLLLLPGSPACFQEVAAVAAGAKNMVLWKEVEIGKEGLGIVQGEAEENRIVVGMAAAEVVRGCMSEVAVGLDEHILAAVMKGDMVAGWEVWCMTEVAAAVEVGMVEPSSSGDEGIVVADIAVQEAVLDEGVAGADIAGWATEPDGVDTGKAVEKMTRIAVVVVRVAAHNYGVYKIADMVEEAEVMFDKEERILATRECIVGEAEKVIVEGEYILAMRENIVGELGPTSNDWIAIVLARDEAVALGYGIVQ